MYGHSAGACDEVMIQLATRMRSMNSNTVGQNQLQPHGLASLATSASDARIEQLLAWLLETAGNREDAMAVL